ncbi:serine hydrolase domain-containing protein [Parvularcula lutaonensis]|uniref:Serine hydrolase domain-containing protein n=1 Tax=Parvularcula lutaonensis TaxID=491923 RepID=A0ABV7M8U1_9PROT|nr:serine hydrolase domain-containing protein [Parvularcula lutaonensis]GGY44860.1 serine hydrolase [Parvularcula lutaonensis]
MQSVRIIRTILGAALLVAIAGCASGNEIEAEVFLHEKLGALQAERADVPGFAMAVVLEDGRVIGAGTGVADPEGRAMTARTPVRIASITKTFVAAAILRLHEDGQLDLDAAIASLLEPEVAGMLRADGYDSGTITVRHLLMHAGGLADHASTDDYLEAVFSEPSKVWTPEEQVAVLVEATDPLGPPGKAFAYSDTGYVILGMILERRTHESLPQAVRKLTKLDELGLDGTWWDGFEQRPAGIPDRAHQFIDGDDTYAVHGSMDAFGGGGLIASAEDVARFYHALFSGRIFEDPATLELMTTAPGHPEGSPYRIGLFSGEIEGHRVFSHGGFWGTYVGIDPKTGRVVAGVALDQSGYQDMRAVLVDTLLARPEPKSDR